MKSLRQVVHRLLLPQRWWLFLFFGVAPVLACAPRVVYVHEPPPPVKIEVKPPKPAPHAVWIPGHWKWNGRRYVWVPGHWELRPRGKTWVPGHWKKTPRGWVWIPGHWK